MKLYDIVMWDDPSSQSNEIVAYKHEAEDFNTHTQLIVHASQQAIFFKDGMALDLFEAGKHTLSTQNIPLLNKLINIPTGGQTPFHCEVYFVNKVFLNDLRWGTPQPIVMEDPVEGVNIHVGANGLFGAHIEDARKFLVKVVGTRAMYSKDEMSQYLRAKIIERVTDLLGKTMGEHHISILQVAAHFQRLSDSILEQMKPFFAEYGIGLDNFSFNMIKAPDEDLKAINEAKIAAKRMDMESEALARKRAREGYNYQQERAYDVLGAAAANEGSSGTFMGAGMGLGMGVGMGGAFGAGMAGIGQNAFQNINQPVQQAQGNPCPQCGAQLPAGAKFCGNCGAKIGGNAKCTNCGADLPAGAKFCGNCGAKVGASVCPKCGSELPADAKFCGNCGEKI